MLPDLFVFFCGLTAATATDGLEFVLFVWLSFFLIGGWELGELSDESESELLSDDPDEPEPPPPEAPESLFELVELSDFICLVIKPT